MKTKKESYVEYRRRMMDPISSSFCAAKWYNATIWLGSGTTASCHHPPAHRISKTEIKKDFRALHNTTHKKLIRAQMLRGERPIECDYCWKIEDIKSDNISDRVFKTIIYNDKDVEALANVNALENVVPKTLEIAFDRTCNFACSYCNSSFSTKWARDIQKSGPYENLFSDGARPFQIDGSWAAPYSKNEENPYIEAFWKWWPELSQSLTELRVTGGEPLLSPDLWKLLDQVRSQELPNLRIAINSNLGVSDRHVDRLIEASREIPNIDLYTSCEAFGSQAEYIRDGLIFENFAKNMQKVFENGNFREIHIMMTVNSLSLFSMIDFLDAVLAWRAKYESLYPALSVNLLRFPSFMSPAVLPDHLKKYCSKALSDWLELNESFLRDFEQEGLKRLIAFLDAPPSTEDRNLNWSDFRSFFRQYDKRRGKSFVETFPKILTDWYQELQTMDLPFSKPDEDSSLAGVDFNTLQKIAEAEGWILLPEEEGSE